MSRRVVPLSLPRSARHFASAAVRPLIDLRWHYDPPASRCQPVPAPSSMYRAGANGRRSSAVHCGMFQKEFLCPPCNVFATLPFLAHAPRSRAVERENRSWQARRKAPKSTAQRPCFAVSKPHAIRTKAGGCLARRSDGNIWPKRNRRQTSKTAISLNPSGEIRAWRAPSAADGF